MVIDYIDDRAFEAEPLYFTDMDSCEPSSAVSPSPGLGRWRTLAYEAEGLSGTMLLAGPETAAAPVTYRLPVSGWHAISVGSYGGVVWAGEGSRGVHLRTKTLVLARLTGEPTFSPLSLPEAWLRPGEEEDEVLRDMYWKVADLTGQDIVLGQLGWRVAAGDGPGSFASHTARIAYVKVVPLSDAEVEAVQADRRRSDTKGGLRSQRHVLLLLRVPPHDRGRYQAAPGAEPRQRHLPRLLGGGRRRPAQVPLPGWARPDLRRPERLSQGGRPAPVGGEEGAEGQGHRPGASGDRPHPRDGRGVSMPAIAWPGSTTRRP